MLSSFLAVAITRWPCDIAVSAKARPKPVEQPVMRKTALSGIGMIIAIAELVIS